MSQKLHFGLIGAHLTHSYSPEIHRALADYSYDLIELTPEALPDFLRQKSFDGLNVTIPYKQTVIPHLDALSDVAERIGAVNTIVKDSEGRLIGHNTDCEGLRTLLHQNKIVPKGKKVLILGSGGAAKATECAIRDLSGIPVIISRKGENNYENLFLHEDAALLINATPVGMYPQNGQSPLSLTRFPHLEAVIDLIYNPLRTALLQEAAALGIKSVNGLFMLVAQAAAACALFTGCAPDPARVQQITNDITAQAENIILIGMPGCGKTTLGRLLAAELDRPFIDADEELVREAKRTIPEIFESEGEVGFRRRETATLQRLGAARGCVIATGGGAVTVKKNYAPLHQNGKIVFLNVTPEGLPIAGRPLSTARTPEALYRERLPLYRAFADVTVDITRDVTENLIRIKEALL